MYTESVENEIKFLVSLWDSQNALYYNHHMDNKDRAAITAGECPNCHKGSVVTQGIWHGDHSYISFNHYCDNCGEQFSPVRIRSDIFFHKPYLVLEKLSTPFGDINVKINGTGHSFHCRTDTYEDRELSPGRSITMYIIDINLSGLKPGDTVYCGFDHRYLEYNDSDERSVLYSCEDDEKILGLCAYEPQYHECERDEHCYVLDKYDAEGFGYLVTTDPNQFDEHYIYESKIVSLAVAWINKADYKNYEDTNDMLFLALTSVIG